MLVLFFHISGSLLYLFLICLQYFPLFRFLTLPNSDHSTDIAILELWPAMTTWVRQKGKFQNKSNFHFIVIRTELFCQYHLSEWQIQVFQLDTDTGDSERQQCSWTERGCNNYWGKKSEFSEADAGRAGDDGDAVLGGKGDDEDANDDVGGRDDDGGRAVRRWKS